MAVYKIHSFVVLFVVVSALIAFSEVQGFNSKKSLSVVHILAIVGLCSSSTVYDNMASKCCAQDECFPGETQISALSSEIEGIILTAPVSGYWLAAHMYNTNEYKKPGLMAYVKSASDIQKVILFTKQYNLYVTIRSSGHDYTGRSTGVGSVNINLSGMKYIDVDLAATSRNPHGELKVQTGITWADIYKQLNNSYRVVVGGSAHTVTPGGYTLGGGHSPISRSFGYAVDNVLETQVVLADGRIATCFPNRTDIEEVNGTTHTVNDGDLFWALMGGGGGTFGVTVYNVYRLYLDRPMVSAVGNFPLMIKPYDIDITTRVFSSLQQLLKNLPKEWGGYWLINNGEIKIPKGSLPHVDEDIVIKGMVTLALNKFGPYDAAVDVPLFAEFQRLHEEYTLDFELKNKTNFWDYEKNAADPPMSRVYLVSTLIQEFSDDLFDMIRKEFFQYFTGKDEYVGCTGIMVGDKTTERAANDTPLNPGYRTARTVLSCGVALGDPVAPGPLEDEQCLIDKADAFNKRLRPLGQGMYFNEPTKNNENWKEDFWSMPHYNRLLQIKQRYDPDNFFTCMHCVGSDLAPTSSHHSTCKFNTNVVCDKPTSRAPLVSGCRVELLLVCVFTLLTLV